MTKSIEKNNESEGDTECGRLGKWFAILYKMVRGHLSDNIWTSEQRPGGIGGCGVNHMAGPDFIGV